MFRRLPDAPAATVTVTIDGTAVEVPAGISAAAAVLAAGAGVCRTTPVGGRPRAPYCMMGVCFDCLMEIDGVANVQACQVEVRDGMVLRRQAGARELSR